MVSAPILPLIGQRFPSEKRVVPDPVTGVPLTFLTSKALGDSKIYQTHPQWTADGKWVVFRSRREIGQAFAVNEESGDIVQVTGLGFTGMLCLAQKSMRLFHLRLVASEDESAPHRVELVAIDLEALFADSEAGEVKPAAEYEQVFGSLPPDMGAAGDLALDATEEVAYFRVIGEEAAKHIAAGTKIEPNFGPRNMGAGPSGIGSMDLRTGEVKVVVAVPFQVGHIQTNHWVPGEIIFSWETGGKAPQRTWTVMADGTGLRPLYREASYDWVTHEAVITRDEVALAIVGHREPGFEDEWGVCGSRDHATGLGIVNLRTHELFIAGQTKSGSGFWHVNGSPDGRWAVGDDFERNIYLIDRRSNEMMLLSTGHKETAADHPHPTFSADSTRIEIQSAMLSEDGRSLNICVIPVPDEWLKRGIE
ncbi:hypothetical protein EON83_16120 [bacterium]|nr:MAG: hypothetical protein EON83_16120 [bacterium]